MAGDFTPRPFLFCHAAPCLTMPRLASPCLPCPSMPCLPCLAWPRQAVPGRAGPRLPCLACRALPCRAKHCRSLPSHALPASPRNVSILTGGLPFRRPALSLAVALLFCRFRRVPQVHEQTAPPAPNRISSVSTHYGKDREFA